MTRATTRLIQYHPYTLRNECCAIGVLAVLPTGEVRAHLADNLRKVRAMHPACDLQALRDAVQALAQDISAEPALLALYANGSAGGPLRVAPSEGYFHFETETDYKAALQWALSYAVNPGPSRSQRERATTSRLFLEVKQVFNQHGWLARMGQGIRDHVIVPRYPLSQDEGLSVDFALKNGLMHYLQTADFRSATTHPAQRRNETQAKLFSLGIADQLTPLDMGQTARYLVVAGAQEADAQKALKLAQRVTDRVFVHESSQDMTELMDLLSTAMGQEPMPSLSTE